VAGAEGEDVNYEQVSKWAMIGAAVLCGVALVTAFVPQFLEQEAKPEPAPEVVE
jgi:hypothetical protein